MQILSCSHFRDLPLLELGSFWLPRGTSGSILEEIVIYKTEWPSRATQSFQDRKKIKHMCSSDCSPRVRMLLLVDTRLKYRFFLRSQRTHLPECFTAFLTVDTRCYRIDFSFIEECVYAWTVSCSFLVLVISALFLPCTLFSTRYLTDLSDFHPSLSGYSKCKTIACSRGEHRILTHQTRKFASTMISPHVNWTSIRTEVGCRCYWIGHQRQKYNI